LADGLHVPDTQRTSTVAVRSSLLPFEIEPSPHSTFALSLPVLVLLCETAEHS
jgi:hypothetical protein